MSLDTLHTDAEPTTPPTSMPPATLHGIAPTAAIVVGLALGAASTLGLLP